MRGARNMRFDISHTYPVGLGGSLASFGALTTALRLHGDRAGLLRNFVRHVKMNLPRPLLIGGFVRIADLGWWQICVVNHFSSFRIVNEKFRMVDQPNVIFVI